MPSRRRLLAVSAGTVAALAGCTNRDGSSPTPSDSPTDTDVPTPRDRERPTQTPRDPTPLDVSGAWPQEGGGPGHHGVTDATGVPADGEAYWHLRRVRSGPPVFADGRLFHFGLAGRDESGTPTRTLTPSGTSQPLDGEKALFCRDARDGRLLWTRPLDYRSGWPTVAAGHVLAAGAGFVAVYRVDDGTEAWRRDLGEREASVSTAIDGTALVSSEFVREGPRKPDVRAYRIEDGTPRWKRSSPEQAADLAATGDTVFARSSTFEVGSVLTARALSDGRERWSVDLGGNGLARGPFVADDTVYVAPDDQGVYAFAAADGAERWHREGETANVVGVAASGDTAYLVDHGTLYAVAAADGAERWSVGVRDGRDHGYRSVPAVGSDAIYVEKDGFPASFAALSRADGSENWTRTLPETTVGGDMVTSGLAAQPAVAEGGVFAYAQDGLYAFGPAN